jgi:hypothetical protein
MAGLLEDSAPMEDSAPTCHNKHREQKSRLGDDQIVLSALSGNPPLRA